MCAPLRLAESFCSDVQESGLLDYHFYRVTLASSWRMAYRRAGRERGGSFEEDFSDPGER